MADNEQRVGMEFSFIIRKTAFETVSILHQAWGKIQVYEWYSHFTWDEMSVEDQRKYGWPSTCQKGEDLVKVHHIFDEDCR